MRERRSGRRALPAGAASGPHLLQDALVEELLQLLVAVVDAELLKAVVLKVLCGGERGR